MDTELRDRTLAEFGRDNREVEKAEMTPEQARYVAAMGEPEARTLLLKALRGEPQEIDRCVALEEFSDPNQALELVDKGELTLVWSDVIDPHKPQ